MSRTGVENSVGLGRSMQHAVAVLDAGPGGEPSGIRDVHRIIDGARLEVRATDLAHFAGLDEPIERHERIFDRGVRVRHVKLVEVDSIRVEPSQTVLDGSCAIRRGDAPAASSGFSGHPPNLVAMIALSRRSPNAAPKYTSDRMLPHICLLCRRG